MRLWRSRALTRDLVALTTVLSAARHYNVTMESRSFHIVDFSPRRAQRIDGHPFDCRLSLAQAEEAAVVGDCERSARARLSGSGPLTIVKARPARQ